MHLGPGSMIGASVRLERPLGAGGMGAVWVAEHLGLNTKVVVKFLGDHLASVPEALARFKREASSASSVKSPHVVQMFDFGVTPDGTPYIVMELLEGQDLRHRLQRGPRLAPIEIAAIVTQVAKALGRAHEAGVVHRDIKPDNIFLTDVGGGEIFVKVLDFGIAKAGASQGFAATRTGAAMGTPYYMSPEQTLGAKGVDHRTDLWSLGIVAFEALTRTRPFEAETIGALAVAICHGPMPVPSQIDPALGPAVDAWFARACARDVNARFSSARELAEALDAAVRAPVPAVARSYVDPLVGPTLPMTDAIVTASTQLAAAPVMTTTGAVFAESPDPPLPRTGSRLPLVAALVAGLGLVGGGAAYLAGSSPRPSSAAAASAEEAVEPASKGAEAAKKTEKKAVDEPAEAPAASTDKPASKAMSAPGAALAAKDACAPGNLGPDGRCACPAGYVASASGNTCTKKLEAAAAKAPASSPPLASTKPPSAKPPVNDPNIF